MAHEKVAKHLWNLLLRSGSTWATISGLEDALAKNGLRYSDWKTDKQFVFHKEFVTLKTISDQEDEIAYSTLRLLYCGINRFALVKDEHIDKLIDKFEDEVNEGRKLHIHQRDAVRMVVRNNFSILTGGPGTGKTTVLSCITYVLRSLVKEQQIIFTAPTGKAARRIKESTGEHARTTCKEFGITPEERSAYEFEGDVLFIDESSMNDNETLSLILAAVKEGKKICLVGDVDQLPSVGIGACLRDLIASKVVPVTMLTHTFRQDNSSKLFANISNIRRGSAEIVDGEDYHSYCLPGGLSNEEAEAAAIEKIREIYREQINKYGAENVVVLVPFRQRNLCSITVNKWVQRIANKKNTGYRHVFEDGHNETFCVDDFVMQLENRTECANGDVGKVITVTESGIDVRYVDCEVHYDLCELDQLALAYSMTIHKSQGSEYPCVIMCMLDEHSLMLSRNLLYTGVTRAKKECCLIYQEAAYKTAVSTVADANRITMLKEKLIKLNNVYVMSKGVRKVA